MKGTVTLTLNLCIPIKDNSSFSLFPILLGGIFNTMNQSIKIGVGCTMSTNKGVRHGDFKLHTKFWFRIVFFNNLHLFYFSRYGTVPEKFRLIFAYPIFEVVEGYLTGLFAPVSLWTFLILERHYICESALLIVKTSDARLWLVRMFSTIPEIIVDLPYYPTDWNGWA